MSQIVTKQASPFSGKYFDGVDGFNVKLNVTEYNNETVNISLMKNVETKEWTVKVKAEKQVLFPNISCSGFSQTSEWTFQLAQSIDENTLVYENLDGYLILRAKYKTVEVQENRGTKRKEISTEFSDQNVKRFRRNEDEEDTSDGDDEQQEGIVGFLPLEILAHIFGYLEQPNDIRKCGLVCAKWQEAVQLMFVPATLTIDNSFFMPAKYLNFVEVFQGKTELPFDAINYVYKHKPNISHHAVLDFISERGTQIELMYAILEFEKHNDRQRCTLLEWISSFNNLKRLRLRLNGYIPGVPIDYGNCNLAHIKDIDVNACFYKQIQNDLVDRCLMNNSQIIHAYDDPKSPSDLQ